MADGQNQSFEKTGFEFSDQIHLGTSNAEHIEVFIVQNFDQTEEVIFPAVLWVVFRIPYNGRETSCST
ncbi:hypothetical protein Pyn_05461 [Prunus yedoensis var. nudiflora]|uniref:Uncharacterized protein n=1 Tax=Prunus yedoensis var. nudiflora TaxID=2094558 RepID=A0A314U7Y3_PRUYE|nr:hypothetical protein Pyn_05461 [Prunus yedoensis var. nudiflora]